MTGLMIMKTISNGITMKKYFMMVIAMTMMTIGFVSCSASDDEMGETVSRVTTDESGFSLLSYSMTAGSAVSEESNSKAENDEKLVCKVLPGGQLMLTHKNVIFDQGTNIKFATQLVGKKLIITETGDYGKSGQYGYYTLVAKVGTVKDGDYVVVVMRNNHAREEFKLKYDSSRAN